jgi:hypothetical protein
MTINLLTYIGAFAVSYWFVFKLLPRLEGKR